MFCHPVLRGLGDRKVARLLGAVVAVSRASVWASVKASGTTVALERRALAQRDGVRTAAAGAPAVARPLILRITISGAFLALNCENQPHGFGTG